MVASDKDHTTAFDIATKHDPLAFPQPALHPGLESASHIGLERSQARDVRNSWPHRVQGGGGAAWLCVLARNLGGGCVIGRSASHRVFNRPLLN